MRKSPAQMYQQAGISRSCRNRSFETLGMFEASVASNNVGKLQVCTEQILEGHV